MLKQPYIYVGVLLLLSLGSCAASQENAVPGVNSSQEILMKLRPAGSKENKKALDLVIRLFESEKIQVDAGVEVPDLALQRCGRLDKDWIRAFRKKNRTLTGDSITSPMTVVVPPCPFWKRAGQVTIPKGGTLS